MSLASIREIAAIHEITDPWLSIRSYSQAKDSGGLYPEGPYALEAEVKANPGTPLDADLGSALAARNVRSHLLDRAGEALDALEAAGWKLTAAWSIEMTTRVTPIRGGLPVHDRIGAVIRFTVDRDRTEEEMAMDPDVMAARILGY